MFCVECGSEDRLYGHLCRECLLSKKLVSPPEYLEVQTCQSCTRIMDGPVWKNTAPEVVASRQLDSVTGKHPQVERIRWDVPAFPVEKGEHRVICTANSLIAGEELAQEFDIGIRVRVQNCPSCSRQSGDYYEAIIQLRLDGLTLKTAENELLEETEMLFGMVDTQSAIEENAFVTKYSPVKGGMDFYMGSVALARAIANKFRNRFGATVAESPSLVGMKDGRDLYRYSILVRLPSFREGDVVALDRKVHAVMSGDGKGLVLRNARTGQIVRVSPDDVHLKMIARHHDVTEAVVVTHDHTTIQILDPDSMVAVTVSKPPYMKKPNETVPVVRYDDELHAV